MNTRIAIVGMGSRGLSLLEQFIALGRQQPARRLQLDLYDPQPPGSGLHLSEQPDYLMLNTMAGQLSAFCTAHPAAQPAGPTFLQWCQAQDLRLDARGHLAVEGTGRPIAFDDFVPRRLLGRYLHASYRWLLERCPANLEVQHHSQRVLAARPLPTETGWQLSDEAGQVRSCDALFITCGHARATPVAEVQAGQRVLIEGLGLTAMDTLAALTEGRGGRFVADDGLAGWRYQASGREPQICLYSRSGQPFHARPAGDASPRPAWPRRFFTAMAIEQLRQSSASGQLDFVGQVLPLIEDEMRAVFYQARVQIDAPGQLAGLQQDLQAAATAQARSRLFARLAVQWGAFEPGQWQTTGRWQGAAHEYAGWYRQWIEQDLLRSRLGAAHSPLTQALEVWRDYRDLLRQVVDQDGLLAHSTLVFYGTFAGLSNRLVGGPQRERYEDLLALIDAGVVQVLPPMQAPGQGQVLEGDLLIQARVAPSGLAHNRHALLDDLLRQGLIRAAHPYPADGVDINPSARPRRADGSVHARLWVLGPAVEGSLFYNHYVPTPDPQCLAPLQARRAVQDCLSNLAMPCAVAV